MPASDSAGFTYFRQYNLNMPFTLKINKIIPPLNAAAKKHMENTPQ
jgi:hypothetical protein